MKKIILVFTVLTFSTFNHQAQTVTDIDGNVYHTVHIGTQVWMVENLKTTRYNNGSAIPLVTDNAVWIDLSSPAFCWYNNDSTYKNTYGALYNWYTVNTNKLAPQGWHVPTQEDWIILSTFLGGDSIAGGKMKSIGTMEGGTGLWHTPNAGATNEYDFSGYPGGLRDYDGSFQLMGYVGYWWTSTENSCFSVWLRLVTSYDAKCRNEQAGKDYGYSIRCVSDYPASINHVNDIYKLKIFPNPATDYIFIDYAEEKELNLLVYNLWGALVMQKSLKNNTNKVNISFLPKGIYLLHITCLDWEKQFKLVKE